MNGSRPARPRPRSATGAGSARPPASGRSAVRGARARRTAARSVAPNHRGAFVQIGPPPAPAASSPDRLAVQDGGDGSAGPPEASSDIRAAGHCHPPWQRHKPAKARRESTGRGGTRMRAFPEARHGGGRDPGRRAGGRAAGAGAAAALSFAAHPRDRPLLRRHLGHRRAARRRRRWPRRSASPWWWRTGRAPAATSAARPAPARRAGRPHHLPRHHQQPRHQPGHLPAHALRQPARLRADHPARIAAQRAGGDAELPGAERAPSWWPI